MTFYYLDLVSDNSANRNISSTTIVLQKEETEISCSQFNVVVFYGEFSGQNTRQQKLLCEIEKPNAKSNETYFVMNRFHFVDSTNLHQIESVWNVWQ